MKNAIVAIVTGFAVLMLNEVSAQQPASPAPQPPTVQAEAAQVAPETGESGMAAAFENTLVTRIETGPETRWLFDADGLFTAEGPDGAVSRGAWTVDGLDTCITPENGQRTCLALIPPGAQVGQSWQARSASGRDMTIRLEEGRQ